MKNLAVYYLEVLFPFIIILILFKSDYSFVAVISLLIYAALYRPLIDYQRLKSKGVVNESFWKLYIPLFRIKYFKQLYTNI